MFCQSEFESVLKSFFFFFGKIAFLGSLFALSAFIVVFAHSFVIARFCKNLKEPTPKPPPQREGAYVVSICHIELLQKAKYL